MPASRTLAALLTITLVSLSWRDGQTTSTPQKIETPKPWPRILAPAKEYGIK